MRRTIIITALLLVFLKMHLSNAQNIEWVMSFGGNLDDFANSIIVDKKGNIYITGVFYGNLEFNDYDISLTSSGDEDIFILKIDSLYNLIWAKSFGGAYIENGNSVIDSYGNIYTTGCFRGIIDFDPGSGVSNLTSNGSEDVFMQKLDSTGALIWARSVGGQFSDKGYSIIIDDSSNIYTTGFFTDTANFDPEELVENFFPIGPREMFILKMNSSGNFLWNKSIGSTSKVEGYSIALDPTGNIYTTGCFVGTVDFDPGPGILYQRSIGTGNTDIYVQKLDAHGDFNWYKSIGGWKMDCGRSIVIDNDYNVYNTGIFSDQIDFDTGPESVYLTSSESYTTDIYVQKLDSSGTLQWAKSLGGKGFDYGEFITVDEKGYIYITGTFVGNVDFDPGPNTFNLTSAGMHDIFIIKMDSTGNFLWATSIGGVSNDYIGSVYIDKIGNLYITGSYEGEIEFAFGSQNYKLTSKGLKDVFVIKLNL